MQEQFDHLMAAGRFHEAEKLAREQALATINSLGDNHPRAIKYCILTARALCRQEKRKEAREVYEATLKNMLSIRAPDHQRVEAFVEEIASLYRTDLFETVSRTSINSIFSNAVDRLEQRIGSDHVRIAKALTIWSWFCWQAGDYEQAISLCDRTESILLEKCREARAFKRVIRRDQLR